MVSAQEIKTRTKRKFLEGRELKESPPIFCRRENSAHTGACDGVIGIVSHLFRMRLPPSSFVDAFCSHLSR